MTGKSFSNAAKLCRYLWRQKGVSFVIPSEEKGTQHTLLGSLKNMDLRLTTIFQIDPILMACGQRLTGCGRFAKTIIYRPPCFCHGRLFYQNHIQLQTIQFTQCCI